MSTIGTDSGTGELTGWMIACALGVAVCTGCLSPIERGDRALEAEQYRAAMDHYDEAFEQGNDDPGVYYRAARAAQRHGAFARAERYYSQSLRNGGGVPVAKALAEFYIQTNNFARAVRVFQYLLNIEEDEEAVQPLYSNLGTALMYAGQYLDAETYLMLAQETDPADPVPYLNLGVLYDRHLRNRPKAVKFYECFTQMAQSSSRVRNVDNRLRQLENRRPIDTSRVNLTCGEPYRASVPEQRDLQQVFDLEFGDSSGEEEFEPAEETFVIESLDLDAPLEYEPETPESAIEDDGDDVGVSDRQEGRRQTGDDAASNSQIEIETPGDSEDSEGGAASYAGAEEAFEDGRYDEAVEQIEILMRDRGAELDTDARELLGRSYYRVGRYEDAAESLQLVIDEQPTPAVVERLLEVYRHLERGEERRRICGRFSEWPDYQEALQDCE